LKYWFITPETSFSQIYIKLSDGSEYFYLSNCLNSFLYHPIFFNSNQQTCPIPWDRAPKYDYSAWNNLILNYLILKEMYFNASLHGVTVSYRGLPPNIWAFRFHWRCCPILGHKETKPNQPLLTFSFFLLVEYKSHRMTHLLLLQNEWLKLIFLGLIGSLNSMFNNHWNLHLCIWSQLVQQKILPHTA